MVDAMLMGIDTSQSIYAYFCRMMILGNNGVFFCETIALLTERTCLWRFWYLPTNSRQLAHEGREDDRGLRAVGAMVRTLLRRLLVGPSHRVDIPGAHSWRRAFVAARID